MKTANRICASEANAWVCLLEKLHDFDQQTGPVGLYGIRDYQTQGTPNPQLQLEWERVIKPTMKSLGCNPVKNSPCDFKTGAFRFQAPSPIEALRALRLSKIKVRKYGNAYRVDPHREFENRWKEAGIASILHDLWKRRCSEGCLVLLIGFADEEKPFAVELNELQSTHTFSERINPALTKTWDDPHGRGFKVMTALWYIPGKREQ